MLRDPASGKKRKTKSKKWWGQYKDANGKLKRVPLAADKHAAQSMLSELVKQVERVKAGLADPTDTQRRRPLKEHFQEFENHLNHRGVTPKYIRETTAILKKIAANRKWFFISDITSASLLEYLGQLRNEGLSAQTYNHNLKAAKSFTHWLVRDRRTPFDPLVHLARLNVKVDRRHDRRPLTQEEFNRVVETARKGKSIEEISGPDRAMLYILAAWTGFRKGEIGSLTLRSLRLEADPPTATVAACFSKHRREDTQVLHPELVRQIKDWLATKKCVMPNVILFPISGRVPGGTERKTHKMLERDLMAARDEWLKEVENDKKEYQKRLKSDFLCYCNHAGLYADFHSFRHMFITNLERAGISPKMAQVLARHSDIRLTMDVYTHVELHDQTAAIGSLPAPPSEKSEPIVLHEDSSAA
jgi:integrase/recombinase XerD